MCSKLYTATSCLYLRCRFFSSLLLTFFSCCNILPFGLFLILMPPFSFLGFFFPPENVIFTFSWVVLHAARIFCQACYFRFLETNLSVTDFLLAHHHQHHPDPLGNSPSLLSCWLWGFAALSHSIRISIPTIRLLTHGEIQLCACCGNKKSYMK